MKPYDKNEEYELPPLKTEADDIPMTLGDIGDTALQSLSPPDMSNVDVQPISDMDNTPVTPPPPENFKAAKRRSRYKPHENGYSARKPYAEQEQLDKFYAKNEELIALAKLGKKNALVFSAVFIPFAIVYVMIDFQAISFMLCFIEILLCAGMLIGNLTAKHYLTIMCFLNTILCTMNFFGAFYGIIKLFEHITRQSLMPDGFTRAAFLAAAILSAAAAVILILSRSIYAYCENTPDLIEELSGRISLKADDFAERISKRFFDHK